MSEDETFECHACGRRMPKLEARFRRQRFAPHDSCLCSECYSACLIHKVARGRQNRRAWAGAAFGAAIGVVLLSLFSAPHKARNEAAASGGLTSVMPDIEAGDGIGEAPKDIFKTKNRLVELGFLNGPVDHVSWDKKSRMALRRFKTAEGLTGDDVWDEKVGGLLFSTNAIRAPMPLARRLR
jgi:hypothetical protein